MSQLSPRLMKWLLAAAYLVLLVALGLQRLQGGLTGNWSAVLFSFTLFTLAFVWGLPTWRKK